MHPPFSHQITTLTGIPASRLADGGGLPGVTLAAASAMGLSSYGPPVVRSGPRGVVVGLLCHGGHVVLHAIPDEALCIVDVLALPPARAERGIEVISRRLKEW
ncbi:MAG: S-adenosylmethionine decarboxylase [Gemmatimonadales bacterium]